MNIKEGSIVKAIAGREKDSYYVAVGIHDGFVEIADGKERKLEKPKRKNIKHISPENAVIDTTGLTNKKLRKLILMFKTQNKNSADDQP
ncbi:MAG: KOW domain-containing RNA-binding protein [Ruminococcus sp.]|nr:KOW domain-containing RNA-binding protein [Ruminococcus sp.]